MPKAGMTEASMSASQSKIWEEDDRTLVNVKYTLA